MKKIIILMALFIGAKAFGQADAIEAIQKTHQECLDKLSQQSNKEGQTLLNRWYLDNPDPKRYVMMACADHCPKYYCARHHKQCEGACDCATLYRKEGEKLDAKYEQLKAACEKEYQDAMARVEKEQAEKEKAAEEKAAREEARQKAEKEKADKEKETSEAGQSGNDNSRPGSGSASDTTYTPPQRDARIDRNFQASQAQDSSMTQVLNKTQAIMAAGMIAGIEDESDDDSHPFYLKLNLGIGFENLPIIGNTTLSTTDLYGNQTVTNSGTSTSTSNLMIKASFLLSFFNNKFINFKLSPFGSWGNNAYSTSLLGGSGPVGDHITGGSGASIGLGNRLRLTLNGEYAYRSGSYSQDSYPVVNAVTIGSYSYSTLKYGPGIWYSLKMHDAFLEAVFYKEKVSFLSTINANVYSARIKASFEIFSLDFEYGSNYPQAGTNSFPKSYTPTSQSYYMVTLSVPFTLAKK